MLRRGGSGRLRSNDNKPKEDINPMSYVANLVDAMLVLAVGIMLALIISWNLNVSSSGQVTSETQADESAVTKDDAVSSFTGDDVAPAEDKEIKDESKLEEKGTVYYDEGTDTYYIIASDGTTTPLE